ncbi:pyrroline-5-carboxylate reductase [Lutibacter aestuarii]|uniref:Pyrroline-5-carboxylate reductase n=1 Tax=Lutibacter aestuarii TaxID=861111 RepID=A0ABW2Z2R4_9FLAO
MKSINILVIGAGNMGITFAEGMSTSNLLKGSRINVYDISNDRAKEVEAMNIFKVNTSLKDCLSNADIIFLAVKPYNINALFESMYPYTNKDQIFVSVMAGVQIKTIQEGLNVKKVIRSMPNLPAKIGVGLTSFTVSDAVSNSEVFLVERLLKTTGSAVFVKNEEMIDASTSISGSGPAYVFYFMQAIVEKAMGLGFSEEEAKKMTIKTFDGAVKLYKKHKETPNQWIEKVASKGGTTRAALDVLEKDNVKKSIIDAISGAFEKAVELGKAN